MSVGVDGTSGSWSSDGTVGISNSIGSGGTDPHKGGTKIFVNDHMNYEKVFASCGNFIQPYSSNGDTFDGRGSPRPNPWGNCAHAPFQGVVPPDGGTWEGDDSTAMNASWGFSAFGVFKGNGTTGYETTNRVDYKNDGSVRTHVCGKGGHSKGLAGSPVIYNNQH